MRGAGWAIGFVVLWSSGFVGAVLAQPAGSIPGVLAWRYLITAAVLVPAALAMRRAAISATELGQQVAIGLLAHVVFLGGVFGASGAGVPTGTVALVCALQPLLVTVAGRIGWGDRVRLRQVAGLGLGLAAVAASVGVGGGAGAALLLPVASLLGLSGSALLERHWRPATDVVTSLAIQVVVSAVVFAGYAAAAGELRIAVPPTVVGALVWLIVLSGLGGYATYLVCLRRLGSTSTSLLLYLTPPVTTAWAWTMFGELPSAGQWLGLALGAIAVLLAWPAGDGARVSQSDRRRPADAAEGLCTPHAGGP